MSADMDLDRRSIDAIRFLSVDAVQHANSGHPGLPMGAAAMAYVLWTRFLRHSPATPAWPDRDRFVLSAGHGSMLLYSLLHLTGYDLPLTRAVSEAVAVPVIASGGAGEPRHLADAIIEGKADAVLAASIFHFGTYSIREVKEYMAARGLPMRL
jgi:hypothetical protein